MNPLEPFDLATASDEPYVLTAEGAVSRRQILARAARVAAELSLCGARGRNAIVCLDSGADFLAALAGCYLGGAVPVLLDPLVRRELGRAVDVTEAVAVLHGAAAPSDDRVGVRQIAVGAEELPIPQASLSRSESEPLVYLFTSGSTGHPTLVPKSFANVDTELAFHSELMDRPRRVATLVPWCHIYGFLWALLLPARNKGVLDVASGISPRIALERCAAGLVDLIVAVPPMYKAMARILETWDEAEIPRSCRFVTAGSRLEPELRERFQALSGCRITDVYGSTEVSAVAYRRDDGPWIVEPHVSVRVSADGLLEVASPSVSVPGPDGFCRVGDRARLEGAGFVLEGRADDVVKIGGRRTSLLEVEATVATCPGVNHAAVAAETVRGELRLVAYIERSQGGLDAAAVKAFVRSRLSDHKVPSVVCFVDRMPRNPGGKPDRHRLRAFLPRQE